MPNNHYHMGTTAENVAKKYGISREEQDAFAAASQQKAEAAQKAGCFQGRDRPCGDRQPQGQGGCSDTDEFIKHGTTAESLAGPSPRSKRQGR